MKKNTHLGTSLRHGLGLAIELGGAIILLQHLL